MYRTYIRKNITSVAIILFIIIFAIIQVIEPAFLYEKDGSLRQFGLGSSKKNNYPYLVFNTYTIYVMLSVCFVLHSLTKT